jgi:hypothetical protein
MALHGKASWSRSSATAQQLFAAAREKRVEDFERRTAETKRNHLVSRFPNQYIKRTLEKGKFRSPNIVNYAANSDPLARTIRRC